MVERARVSTCGYIGFTKPGAAPREMPCPSCKANGMAGEMRDTGDIALLRIERGG